MNYTGIYTGQVPNRPGTLDFHWWAVEASNLRPQQCECQKASCCTGVSLGNDAARTSENGMREPLFTPGLHRAALASLPTTSKE